MVKSTFDTLDYDAPALDIEYAFGRTPDTYLSLRQHARLTAWYSRMQDGICMSEEFGFADDSGEVWDVLMPTSHVYK